MFVLIIFALVVFILGIFFIAYGVNMYSIRNDKERQQEINNARRMHYDTEEYNLSRVLTCYAFMFIAFGIDCLLMLILVPMLISKQPVLLLAVLIGGYFAIVLTCLIALLTYAAKEIKTITDADPDDTTPKHPS